MLSTKDKIRLGVQLYNRFKQIGLSRRQAYVLKEIAIKKYEDGYCPILINKNVKKFFHL